MDNPAVLAAPSIAITFVEQSVLTEQESSWLELQTKPSKWVSEADWHLILNQAKQGMTGTLKYSVNLFAVDTIQRVIEHWQRRLEGMAKRPTCLSAQLPSHAC